jgi:hypothetical protein
MSIDPVSAQAVGTLGFGAAPLLSRPVPAPDPAPSIKPAAPAPSAAPHFHAIQVTAAFGQDNVIIYRIPDKETGDLIRQIPPEQLLEIARSVRQLLAEAAQRSSVDGIS